MTISKKLSIAIVLALGVQLSADTFFGTLFNDDIQHGNTLILNFAQNLRNQDSTQTETIAQWLDLKVINGSRRRYHHAIIDIITNNDLTEKSKITLLSEIMAQEKKDNIKNVVDSMCVGILGIGTLSLSAWIAIESIKNPTPVWYHPKPRVSITYSGNSDTCILTTSPNWPHFTRITYPW